MCKVFYLTAKDGEFMKDLNVSLLLDFYGNLLSEKQLFIMESYYQEDLSLSEIGEIESMTRQGVHDNINRATKELKQFEEKHGLLARFMQITEAADKIGKIIGQTDFENKSQIQEISSLLEIIKSQA